MMEAGKLVVREALIGEIEMITTLADGVLPRSVSPFPMDERRCQNWKGRTGIHLKEIPAGGHVACWASLGNEIIVAAEYVYIRKMPSPDNTSGRCAYLMNVYVRSPIAHRVSGRQVASWLVQQAKTRGITKIYLRRPNVDKQDV